jgi:adenosylhomocysteine nucleosidase
MVNCSSGLGVSNGATGPCRILLLAALPLEVRPFLRLGQARRRRGLPWPAWEFAVGSLRGLLAVSGMGQNAAREAASRLVAQFRPHLVVSLGFGGALSPDLHHGDLVLGEFFGRYDPVTQVLDPLTPAPTPPRPLPELLRSLTAAGLAAFAGRLITTPWIIHKGRQGGGLAGPPLTVLDLESAAVAQVAGAEGLPFLGLRAITDAAAEEIPDFLAPVGREPGPVGGLDALGWLAADPRRLLELLQLWRHSRLAAARLAEALIVLLPLLETSENLI